MGRIIDVDALIEKCGEWYVEEGPEEGYIGTLKNLIGMQPTVGGWVSVEDRLPEDERFVLVCNDDGKMMVAQYIAETDKWQYRYMAYDVDVWDDTEQGPVEWWMPLPEAPKEG